MSRRTTRQRRAARRREEAELQAEVQAAGGRDTVTPWRPITLEGQFDLYRAWTCDPDRQQDDAITALLRMQRWTEKWFN